MDYTYDSFEDMYIWSLLGSWSGSIIVYIGGGVSRSMGLFFKGFITLGLEHFMGLMFEDTRMIGCAMMCYSSC